MFGERLRAERTALRNVSRPGPSRTTAARNRVPASKASADGHRMPRNISGTIQSMTGTVRIQARSMRRRAVRNFSSVSARRRRSRAARSSSSVSATSSS